MPGRPGPERVGHDVVGVADEDRAVADAREPGDVLDHLGVVVGGRGRPRARRRRASAASRRSRSASVGGASSARGSRAGSSRAPRPRRRSTGRSGSSRTTSWKTMKLATRISSIRRIAWKQCRSCSPDSRLDVARLAGEVRAGRVDPLAARPRAPRHRVLGQPVDLELGVSGGARRRSRRRAGRGRARSARRCRAPACGRLRPRVQRRSRRARRQPLGRRRVAPGSAVRGRGPAARARTPQG